MKLRPCEVRDAPANVNEIAEYVLYAHGQRDDAPFISKRSEKFGKALVQKMDGVDRDFFIGASDFESDEFYGEYVVIKHARLLDFFTDNKLDIKTISSKLIKSRYNGIKQGFEAAMQKTVYALFRGLPHIGDELLDDEGCVYNQDDFFDNLLGGSVTIDGFDKLMAISLLHEVVVVISDAYRAKQPLYPWEIEVAS